MTYAYDYIKEEGKVSICEKSEEHFCHLVIYIYIYIKKKKEDIHICYNIYNMGIRAYEYTRARVNTRFMRACIGEVFELQKKILSPVAYREVSKPLTVSSIPPR